MSRPYGALWWACITLIAIAGAVVIALTNNTPY